MLRALLLGILVVGTAARAADPQLQPVKKDEPKEGAVVASSVKLTPSAPPPAIGPTVLAGVSPTGVEEKPRRGIFAEASLGLFTTMGGSRFFSNGQPFLGLMVGTSIGDNGTFFGAVGIGASSASCFDLDTRGNCRAADSFGATYLEIGASYGFGIATRLMLSGKIVGGLTNLSPAPVVDNTTRVVPDNMFGFHGGFGLALDYDTRLDHFAVGVDVLARYTIAKRPEGSGSLGIPSLAVMPRLRYVF